MFLVFAFVHAKGKKGKARRRPPPSFLSAASVLVTYGSFLGSPFEANASDLTHLQWINADDFLSRSTSQSSASSISSSEEKQDGVFTYGEAMT